MKLSEEWQKIEALAQTESASRDANVIKALHRAYLLGRREATRMAAIAKTAEMMPTAPPSDVQWELDVLREHHKRAGTL